ncbi:CapA family protein [Thiohalorhabdus denitrificans]|uniref:Poly-gamma-glutamate synthesis protein (Capsule biosynthesis protein) n=1 Tax=Thiohalorhabdus denitrificans TaxID=381306 RepID=A0A1G5EVP0_9GAMM|nr:CapA family protein [Thiohalorhabdus denitrificans]SCY31037.1 poly-gamma-glutamate synthesis protein (capsule biosynthesis protein) [Thiohalorhabdus denitrificans]
MGPPPDAIRLFLCGDVMPGRGIDQILRASCPPRLHEPYIKDARDYVELAEGESGPIPRGVAPDYVWGDALGWLEGFAPDRRLINLETAVTRSEDYWRGKGINYRMHPDNAALLPAASIHACALANNHVLDWGYAGLDETLATLDGAGVSAAGAGERLAAAQAPVVLGVPGKGRVIFLAMGSETSGIPAEWAATPDRPGVWLLPDRLERAVAQVAEQVAAIKGPGDVVVASIHWGSNWGYHLPTEQRHLAHALIDEAAVDLVHGHSSHHVRPMERYRDKLILYGCGDFLNDYEGIGGNAPFRDDLSLMYFPDLDPATGRLVGLAMRPMRIHRFRTVDADAEDAQWLADLLTSLGKGLGTAATRDGAGTLHLTAA